MASLRVPAPTPVPTSSLAKRRSFHMPLSSHGMPKAPRALSPERPHRFSALVLPNSTAESSPATPLSPSTMSPPISARSFGTLIDSTPSTPAYSPKEENEEWGNSRITILRPLSSSSSLPSSPAEPAWEMMTPVKEPINPIPPQGEHAVIRPKLPTAASTPLALSRPVKKIKHVAPSRAPNTDVSRVAKTASEEDGLRKQAEAQARKLVEAEESTEKPQPEPSPKTDTAPLGKLATRMKSLLKRNPSEKKKEKKSKPQQEYDRLDDTHWSEM